MSYDNVLVLHASAAETTAFTGPGVEVPTAGVVSVLVNVTAVSGTTPSLALVLQWSHDGTTWAGVETPDTFLALTAVGVVVKTFIRKGTFVRLTGTVTGTTPSMTFVSTLDTAGV